MKATRTNKERLQADLCSLLENRSHTDSEELVTSVIKTDTNKIDTITNVGTIDIDCTKLIFTQPSL